MLKLDEILEIRKAIINDRGYEIVFPDDKIIWLTKKRTIAGLLLLLHYEYGSEADLVGANDRVAEIKSILGDRLPDGFIQDRYGDANKPFSELWTEEGFSCIFAEGMKGNRQYVLRKEDHYLLFNNNAKATRRQLSKISKLNILEKQQKRCNLCGSFLKERKDITSQSFAKDRIRVEFDHRKPVDRGGKDVEENMQALCHYCNKSKRQICFICKIECSSGCVFVSPETTSIVLPTGEDISDRMKK